MTPTAQSHWLETAGLKIAYRTRGAGQPLLLLNGLTRSMATWDHVCEALPGRRTIAFDAPGVGDSPTASVPLSIPRLARIAAQVLDAADVETADVLGFSHGGLVAQQLAFDAPQRVRRLVLVATSCGVGGTTSPQDWWRPLASGSEHPGARPDALAMVGQVMALASWSSIPFLGAIAARTLVVRGAHDRLVPPENGALLARRIPGAALVTLPVGHDVQRADRAVLLAAAVEDFLR